MTCFSFLVSMEDASRKEKFQFRMKGKFRAYARILAC